MDPISQGIIGSTASQVISKKKNNDCRCISIDILNMEEVKGIDFYNFDLYY